MRSPLAAGFGMLCLVLAGAGTAAAQRPVCPPPAPGEILRTSCRTWAATAALRLLDEFTVDQLFKPGPAAFERSWNHLLSAFASKNISENESFRSTARSLDPLHFTPLDRTTGTVLSDLASSPRQLELEPESFGGPVSVRVTLPELLEGGYWRSPDSMQVAFWKQSRVTIGIEFDGTEVAGGQVECVALSPDGLLVRFAEAGSPPVFVQLRDCQP